MAKVNEADARWIVQEREDGANVHGWHWQEKDCLPWSKHRLKTLLEGLAIVEGESCMWIKIGKVESVTGEAYINTRKGKKIPGYEVEVKMTWVGEVREGGKADGEVISNADGGVHFPYIADENADEDPEIRITVSKEGPLYSKCRGIMVDKGRKMVLEKVNVWLKELHSGGPAQGGGGGAPDAPKPKPAASTPAAAAPAAPKAKKVNEEKGTRTLKMTEKFVCRAGDIYDVLTNQQRIMAFTKAPAEFEPAVGGKFSMFSGSVVGENVEMVPGEKLVQKWKFSNWGADKFSTVTITFKEPEPGNTIISLVQSGIPDEDEFGNHNVLDQTEHGWKNLIFGRIRQVFGYGV
eukprot:CAMPEP_0198202678 /NCGR_PEP_ID=MMETSP1445-20131203/5885_1 /TAXON_ID=36898 /ORGANISM="Pyramimonas sp., Strain CCMP2087" /LENGTH=348 /DNA_ID=CAMNT_0043873727 /DNA_START=632 /DNA_END=1678 /DNA_ORIENTATION=+